MRTRILTALCSLVLALSVGAEEDGPAGAFHVACGAASPPQAVAVGTSVQLGSFPGVAAAMAAAANPAFRNQLREKLAQTVLAYSTCALCPPGSTAPKCSGIYRAIDAVPADLSYAIVGNADGTFSVEVLVVGPFSYSLECGLCPTGGA
ncbi:MAG: hypothetical protein IPJ77_00320 [Planctomycetes bacterium]|nr:hypothetical protein [Planctomycetota bacterium]